MDQSQLHFLPRTGDVPLSVSGTLVCRASSQQPTTKRQGPLERRYHRLALFKTNTGRHVGHIEYVTDWPGEIGDALAKVGTLAEVVAWFRAYDPCAAVQGFPPGRGFAERQARLLEAIELGYDAALSALLTELGISEPVE